MDALRRIQTRLGLDYAGIDFALSADRQVVVFEANATMVVPPPAPDPRWDYRRTAVQRIDAAVRRMLLARASGGSRQRSTCASAPEAACGHGAAAAAPVGESWADSGARGS
jgi:hypothetical protein